MNSLSNKSLFLIIVISGLLVIVYLNVRVGKIKVGLNRIYDERTDNSFLDLQSNDTDAAQGNVLCVLLSSNKSIEQRGHAAWNTWARRCKKTYFACNCPDAAPRSDGSFYYQNRLPVLKLDTAEIYQRMGEKVITTLKLIYEKHKNEFKWFLMTDDDTFVFMTNLYRFLRERDHNQPLTYGYNFKTIVASGYHSGGAGILLTHESLRRLYVSISSKKCDAAAKEMFGDVAIGLCSEISNVRMGDSLDSKGRERFHCLSPSAHYWNMLSDWIHLYSENRVRVGEECCSDETISFHYVRPEEMHLLGLYSKLFE